MTDCSKHDWWAHLRDHQYVRSIDGQEFIIDIATGQLNAPNGDTIRISSYWTPWKAEEAAQAWIEKRRDDV